MIPQEIIRRKRDGLALAADEINAFVAGLTSGAIGEGQAAAFAMATFFRGMTRDECAALTRAMMRSGTVLDWSRENLGGPVVDKHSTGGVGDNVSLMLAPALAACGAFVPMISGRGLGHTGGTLDKLEAIPGYAAQPDEALFRQTVRTIGCAIIGQTGELAPADKKLYAIRDVTATVESIPLITASILSKKLAAGLGALVMDVKTGSGAFMATPEASQTLARSIVDVAIAAGLPTVALITDMNEPLAKSAGNAVETRDAIDYLTGRHRDPRLHAVVLALGGALLALAGLAPDAAAGETRIARALDDGLAAEIFGRMVAALGGPRDLIERPDAHLAAAPVIRPVVPDQAGVIAHIDTRAVGLAVVALGGGRIRTSDAIDPAVGFTQLAGLGDTVGPDRPIAMVHARSAADATVAAKSLQEAYRVGSAAARTPVVIERVT